MTTAQETQPRKAPLAFWRVAQELLLQLNAMFGNPEDVALTQVLSREARTLLGSWLRCLEAVLRRLLLIEAAALPPSDAARRRKRGAQKLITFAADAPQRWRASFRCFPPQCATKARASAGTRTYEASAWPMALRYEACLRAFNDPLAYARRIARRLREAARAAATLLARALFTPRAALKRVPELPTLTLAASNALDST